MRVNGWRGQRREVRGCRGWRCEVVVEEEASSFEISAEGKFQPALVSSQEQGLTIALAVSDSQAFKIRLFRPYFLLPFTCIRIPQRIWNVWK